MTIRFFALVLLVILQSCRRPEQTRHEAEIPPLQEIVQPAAKAAILSGSGQIASLIDPAKLVNLKGRGSNPRILRITAILYVAKAAGKKPVKIIEGAVGVSGWADTDRSSMTAAAILRNHDITDKLGSTTDEDITAMRHGKSPAVRKSPYSGDIVSADHIISRAVAPELDNCIANLELMPLRLNQSKNDKIGVRQRDLAKKLNACGLLDDSSKVR